MGDYRAFYCAGRLALQRVSPYDAASLASCESSAVPAPLFRTKPGEVLPAPLPGYLVAVFMPLAMLPFALSALVWFCLLLVAIGYSIFLLSRLGTGPPWILVIVLAIPVCAISLPTGELPPVALLGIAVLATAVRFERRWLVMLGIALAMSEPQVGVAAAVAVCALRRAYWFPVAVTAAALVLISFGAIGLRANLAYFQDVLPAHMLADLPNVQEFSLSWALDGAGLPAAVAIGAGRLWYAAMLGLAFCAGRSQRAKSAPQFAVFAAGAFAVALGPYVHLDHIALAIPVAAWLAYGATRFRIALTAIVVMLAVPLLYVLSAPLLIVVIPCAVGLIAAVYCRSNDIGLRMAAAVTIAVVAVEIIVVRTGTGQHVYAVNHGATILAQDFWARFVRSHNVMTAWSIWLVKLPTWCGVLGSAAASGISSFRRA
jgi:hypothetical protein